MRRRRPVLLLLLALAVLAWAGAEAAHAHEHDACHEEEGPCLLCETVGDRIEDSVPRPRALEPARLPAPAVERTAPDSAPQASGQPRGPPASERTPAA